MSTEFASIPSDVTSAKAFLRYLDEQLGSKIEVQPEPLPVPITPASELPRLFALLMGINKYKDPGMGVLGGPENDVDELQAFLKSRGVPDSNIKIMKGQEVTLDEMKKAIRGLGENTDIKKGDAILIFFSGHGSCCDTPKGWPTGASGGKVHFLCPYDFVQKGEKDYRQGQGLLGIVLSRLLSGVAEAKGNNITLITDACHSFSVSKVPQGADPDVPRTVELPENYTIPLEILDEFSELKAPDSDFAKGVRVSTGYEYGGSLSHVLISGCMRQESCWENKLGGKSRGRFSYQLLDLLNKPGVLNTMSYKEFVQNIPNLNGTNPQHPQCDGFNAENILFGSHLPDPSRKVYRVETVGSKLTLAAGEAQTITSGARFAVYADQALLHKLGDVVVETSKVATSIVRQLDPSQAPITNGFALLTHIGPGQDLSVYMPLDNRLLPVWKTVAKERQEPSGRKRNIELVERAEDARLILSINDRDQVEFLVNDAILKSYGLEKLPQEVDIDGNRVYDILVAAADFFYHLYRQPSKSTLSQSAEMEWFRLDQYTEDMFNGLTNVGNNLNVDGVITVTASPDDEPINYGFRLVNKTFGDLYAEVYNFDVSTLTVDKYNTMVSASQLQPKTKVEPTIPANGAALFGYGDGGVQPFVMGLTPGRSTLDICFVKVFLATKPVDFGRMVMPTPFSSSAGDEPKGPRPSPEKEAEWDCITRVLLIKTS